MLRWCRVHASRIAAAAIASLAAAGGSAVVPHEDDCHDVTCLAMAVEHDAAAHSITAPPTGADTHAQHCLVCHWARSFRPHITARFVPAPATNAGVHVHYDFLTVAWTAPVAQPPLRSPPASPLA